MKKKEWRRSMVGQPVKDLVLLLLWHGFDPWPGNFCMLQVWWGKKKWKAEQKGKRNVR